MCCDIVSIVGLVLVLGVIDVGLFWCLYCEWVLVIFGKVGLVGSVDLCDDGCLIL